MTSRAEKDRRRRARTVARASPPRAIGDYEGAPAPKSALAAGLSELASRTDAAPRDSAETGLAMLLKKKRLTPRQARVGQYYGMLWRTAQISGGPVKIADLNGSGGGGGAGMIAAGSAEAPGWISDCRARLASIDEQLGGWDEGEDPAEQSHLVQIMQMICGAGMRPREITSIQRESEQIEAALRVALDLAGRWLRREGVTLGVG